MKTGSKIKLLAWLLTGLSAALSSCDSAVYDDEGYCETHYRVRFRYDYNMKFADAFASEVDAVTLYLVNEQDSIVWRKTESGARLKEEGYSMEVDIAPGTYDLLAWCSSADPTTFRTGDGVSCRDLRTDFLCEVREDGSQHLMKPLDRLFHGYMADVEFPAAEGETIVYTLPLTKDTNHFVITLQQLSGEPIDPELVEFEIEDDNAHLGWDNEPLTGTPVVYHQWYKAQVSADLGTEGSEGSEGTEGTEGTEGSPSSQGSRAEADRFAGVVAELTTSRLMDAHRGSARLHVYRTDTGATIASVRLIDALLLVMGYENSQRLTRQQYLDYKDEYNLTFFLDENHRWLNGILQIESWRVVYSELELNW